MFPTYEQHHLGRFLPPMPREDFERLRADIAANGLLEPIDLYEGKILDGWSRYRACEAARVEPRFREFTGDNPVGYVLAKNVQRRHLNPVQILRILEAARQALEAEAAARRRAKLRHAPKSPEILVGPNSAQRGRVSEQIAQIAGVGKQTAKDYHAVQLHGSRELKEAVDQEEISISDAAEVARRESHQSQSRAVRRVRAGGAKTLREAAQQQKAVSATVDGLDLPIPERLEGAFGSLAVFNKAKSALSRTQKLVKQIMSGPAAAVLEDGKWQAMFCELGLLRTQLEDHVPYTICTYCVGQGCKQETDNGSRLCRGAGFITRRQYESLSAADKERVRQRS